MEVKAFAATLGLGLVAGAAAAMMIPKQSKVYRVANDAAEALKQEVSQVVSNMTEK